MIVVTIFLTAVLAFVFGALPAALTRRAVRRRDLAWAAGLWLAVWLFCPVLITAQGLQWDSTPSVWRLFRP